MRPLTAQEMLDAWERGRGSSSTDRALLLLAHACPDTSWEALAALPIGERDARLLTLREWAFGPSLTSVTACPACGERLELSFTTADVRVARPAPVDDELAVETDGYEVAFRLPTSTDLDGLADRPDAREVLLERCLESARRDGKRRSVRQLPEPVLDAVVRRMGEADPQADVHTRVVCPECAHAWQAVFDIVSFLWAELESWAHRTLREVHVLASAYGWREGDVLALSPWRRQVYLQLAHR